MNKVWKVRIESPSGHAADYEIDHALVTVMGTNVLKTELSPIMQTMINRELKT